MSNRLKESCIDKKWASQQKLNKFMKTSNVLMPVCKLIGLLKLSKLA